MLSIVKLQTGEVQLQHFVTKQVLKQWDENATLLFSDQEAGGGIAIVDQLGAYYHFSGAEVQSLQVLPNPAQAWAGTAAELLAELRGRFFLPPNAEIHNSYFFITTPTPAITSFPATMAFDGLGETTGAFTLDVNGVPVCQIAGTYEISMGITLVGVSGNSKTLFEAQAQKNAIDIIGVRTELYIQKDEYGGNASVSFFIELAVGDQITGVLTRVFGTEDPSILAAYFTARSTSAPTLNPPKALQWYGSSGPIAATFKVWTGISVSDTNGEFTVDYSSAGFVNPPQVYVSALQTEPSAQNRVWATLSGSVTNVQAVGYTLRGTALTLVGLGPTVRQAPNATVQIMAVGL